MATVYQRSSGYAEDLQPGQYTVQPSVLIAAGVSRPALCCKACGSLEMVGPGYEVDRAGNVTPCFDCPNPACGSLEWIRLDDFPFTRREEQ